MYTGQFISANVSQTKSERGDTAILTTDVTRREFEDGRTLFHDIYMLVKKRNGTDQKEEKCTGPMLSHAIM